MPDYRLTAPRKMGKIPKGFFIHVASASTPKPNPSDVEKAIIQAGFSDSISRSYKSSGNWNVEKLS